MRIGERLAAAHLSDLHGAVAHGHAGAAQRRAFNVDVDGDGRVAQLSLGVAVILQLRESAERKWGKEKKALRSLHTYVSFL